MLADLLATCNSPLSCSHIFGEEPTTEKELCPWKVLHTFHLCLELTSLRSMAVAAVFFGYSYSNFLSEKFLFWTCECTKILTQ